MKKEKENWISITAAPAFRPSSKPFFKVTLPLVVTITPTCRLQSCWKTSPFMVDVSRQRYQHVSLKISPVDSPFTFFNLHRWRLLAAAAAAVFSFQARGDFGGYLVWLSHPPPVLIPAHAMKQNTGDMSASKALSGSQKHLPKYLHLQLLFIHRRRGALLLVFARASAFPIYLSFQEAKKKKSCPQHFLCILVSPGGVK